MQIFAWVILSMTILDLPANGIPSDTYRKHHDSNLCTKLERYKEDHVIPVSKLVRETFKRFCVAIPPICSYQRYKIVNQNETVTVQKSRLIYECCPGFRNRSNSCIPTCQFGCGNGECVKPDVCECEEGWRGHNCTERCEPNRYGKGCKENCTCQHGAECDRVNGFCYCTPGYTGTYCESTCPEGTYGHDCREECDCENGGLCDIVDGYCECQPGYTGDYCEDKCNPGTHGQDCVEDCVCIEASTEFCRHEDGKCICKAGFTGDSCEQECSNSTYGANCKGICDCENSHHCDSIDGECYCDPGWTGHRCEKKCPIGHFGTDCDDVCVPCINKTSTCNHITGFCDCPSGYYGDFCENECPKDYWGSNCTEKCICSEHSTCNMSTGVCICPVGWIGNCSQPCPPGTFGHNCSSECNCNITNLCDAVTGSCIDSTHNETGELNSTETFPESAIIVISIFVPIAVVFLCVYCGRYYLLPTLRNWWNAGNISGTGVSSESIVGVSFGNALYNNPEGVTSLDYSGERRSAFIDIASTIRDRLSSTSVKDTARASSCDTVLENGSSLRRASKVSNLSVVDTLEKLVSKWENSAHSSGAETDEDFIPETVRDFNTAENIMGNLSFDAEKKDIISKLD